MKGFLKGIFGNKGHRILEGLLQGTQVLGASAASLSNGQLRKTLQRFYQGSVHSRVVRRLREILGGTSRFKLEIQVQEMPSYIRGNPAHGPSGVLSRKAEADIKGKWSVR